MAAEGDNIVRFTYTGADDEWIDGEATHITIAEDCTVVRARAFRNHRNIVEVICHENVEEIEYDAFYLCRSLKRVIMPGVKIIDDECEFEGCDALEDVECDKLEIIGWHAFSSCTSLRRINSPSARVVVAVAFAGCEALSDVKFGSKLEEIEEFAFWDCINLERITIPFKGGLIMEDAAFIWCNNLRQVDLIEGELHETIASLQLAEWKNEMNQEIDSINQILPNASAGYYINDDEKDPGEKALEIRRWIRSVLHKIIQYKDKHQRLLNEAATILELALPNDIVRNKVLPFLELPPYTFEVGDDDDDEDSDDDTQSSESSVGDEEEE